MNICIFTGARPNFIKVAPLMWAVEKKTGINATLVYAGREDDPTIEDTLFDDLQIRRPDVFLGVDSANLNEITGKVMGSFENYLNSRRTDAVIVVDDLASTMAAAIVTKKAGITLAHLVAGTRSFDIRMPKEINRLVIDGLSDILFTAGIISNGIVSREGAELSKVYMVGNILIDTLRMSRRRFVKPDINIDGRKYIVFTINRRALLADTGKLNAMLEAMIASAGGMPIIAPLRSEAQQTLLMSLTRNRQVSTALFRIVPPLSYLQFGWLTEHALGIITDSGNVAEEATFNNVPCITLNDYTEHIETVEIGTNVLVGENAKLLGETVAKMVAGRWKEAAIPERWDGHTADRILQIIKEECGEPETSA